MNFYRTARFGNTVQRKQIEKALPANNQTRHLWRECHCSSFRRCQIRSSGKENFSSGKQFFSGKWSYLIQTKLHFADEAWLLPFPFLASQTFVFSFLSYKKMQPLAGFFPGLLPCTCESGLVICFLPCHRALHHMQISHCHLFLHLWILHCLFTSRVLRLIISSAGVYYSHSGTAFYRQWENLPVSPSLFTLVLILKKKPNHVWPVVYNKSCWHTTNCLLLFLSTYPVMWLWNVLLALSLLSAVLQVLFL